MIQNVRLDFFTHPGSRGVKGTGSRIPDPQHCSKSPFTAGPASVLCLHPFWRSLFLAAALQQPGIELGDCAFYCMSQSHEANKPF
jgi:hypothetical protein